MGAMAPKALLVSLNSLPPFSKNQRKRSAVIVERHLGDRGLEQ